MIAIRRRLRIAYSNGFRLAFCHAENGYHGDGYREIDLRARIIILLVSCGIEARSRGKKTKANFRVQSQSPLSRDIGDLILMKIGF